MGGRVDAGTAGGALVGALDKGVEVLARERGLSLLHPENAEGGSVERSAPSTFLVELHAAE